MNDAEASQDLGNALIEVVEIVEQRERRLEILFESERVRQKTAEVFSQIINFCVRARLFFQKPAAGINCPTVKVVSRM